MNIIKSDFAKTFSVSRKFDKNCAKNVFMTDSSRCKLYKAKIAGNYVHWDKLKVQNWILSYFYDKWLLKVKLINNKLIKQLN